MFVIKCWNLLKTLWEKIQSMKMYLKNILIGELWSRSINGVIGKKIKCHFVNLAHEAIQNALDTCFISPCMCISGCPITKTWWFFFRIYEIEIYQFHVQKCGCILGFELCHSDQSPRGPFVLPELIMGGNTTLENWYLASWVRQCLKLKVFCPNLDTLIV